MTWHFSSFNLKNCISKDEAQTDLRCPKNVVIQDSIELVLANTPLSSNRRLTFKGATRTTGDPHGDRVTGRTETFRFLRLARYCADREKIFPGVKRLRFARRRIRNMQAYLCVVEHRALKMSTQIAPYSRLPRKKTTPRLIATNGAAPTFGGLDNRKGQWSSQEHSRPTSRSFACSYHAHKVFRT